MLNITYKPISNYVLTGITEIKKTNHLQIISCGQGISRACTVAEIILFTLNRTHASYTYDNVALKTINNNSKNITEITINLKKQENKALQ